MASFNKVIMMGNLTRNLELKYLPNQTPIVEFGLATNRTYKGKDGEQKEEVCFIECTAYSKSAETLCRYLQKGNLLLIEGRLKQDRWEANGYQHSKHKIDVERFTFMGGGDDKREPEREAERKPEAPAREPGPSDNVPF